MPNGTKRTIGFAIMILPALVPWFGYEMADAAPVEIARFADSVVAIFGSIVMLYGAYKAKAPLWFVKK